MNDERGPVKPLIGDGKMNRKGVILYRFESETEPGTMHAIATQKGSGRVHCTCDDFRDWCAPHSPTLGYGPKCAHVMAHRKRLFEDLIREDEPSVRELLEAAGWRVVDHRGYPTWTQLTPGKREAA